MKQEQEFAPISDGMQRFQGPLLELQLLLKNKKNQKDMGLFLFENGARNHLFKLEALCRIYKNISSKKIFEPLGEAFKLAEDQLGKIDYYQAFLKEFSAIKNIPASFLRYFKNGSERELKVFNEMINEPDLIISQIKSDNFLTLLSQVNWPSREDERKSITIYFADQIEKLVRRYENGELHFNDMENGLHEFRRKLRWISIYAQTLNGLVQLKKTKLTTESFKSYLTADILNSPFNKLPAASKGIKTIDIQAPLFYALSWIIQESGNLKDEGLRILAVNEALKQSDLKTKEAVNTLKTQLIPKTNASVNEISEKMEIIADNFIHRDRVLFFLRRDILRNLN